MTFVARISYAATEVEVEAPDALSLARTVASLGSPDGQAAIASDLLHGYGLHLRDIPRTARSLTEAGLGQGPPESPFTVMVSEDPRVLLRVETDLSLSDLLESFTRLLGLPAASEVLESAAAKMSPERTR